MYNSMHPHAQYWRTGSVGRKSAPVAPRLTEHYLGAPQNRKIFTDKKRLQAESFNSLFLEDLALSYCNIVIIQVF